MSLDGVSGLGAGIPNGNTNIGNQETQGIPKRCSLLRTGTYSDRLYYGVYYFLMIGSWCALTTTTTLGVIDLCSNSEEQHEQAPVKFVLSGIFGVSAILLTTVICYIQKKTNERDGYTQI